MSLTTTVTKVPNQASQDKEHRWYGLEPVANVASKPLALVRCVKAADNSSSTGGCFSSGRLSFGYQQGGKRSILNVETSTMRSIGLDNGTHALWNSRANTCTPDQFRLATAAGGTSPECLANTPAIAEALKVIPLLIFGTDGECSPQALALQMPTHYMNVQFVVAVLVTSRGTAPAAQNISVFAPFFSKQVLVIHTDGTDIKVLYASGAFAMQIAPIPDLASYPGWAAMPSITAQEINAFQIQVTDALPDGYTRIVDPESTAILGGPIMFNYRTLMRRMNDSVLITGDEYQVLCLIFPQLLREAITSRVFDDLEKMIKTVERQAIRSGEVANVPTPIADEYASLVQQIATMMRIDKDQGKDHSPDLVAMRARIITLRQAVQVEREALLGPIRDFISTIRGTTQDWLAQIAAARAAGANFTAGSFLSSATNRTKKACQVKDTFDKFVFDTKDSHLIECPICMTHGTATMCVRNGLTQDEMLSCQHEQLLNFPLGWADLGIRIGFVIPGEQPICTGCAAQLTTGPFTRTPDVAFVPMISCNTAENREYMSTLLASMWTGDAILPSTTRFLLATLVQLSRTVEWLDQDMFRFFGEQLLKFACNEDMSETGKKTNLSGALTAIIQMTQPTAEFPFGALYRQPFSSIQAIIAIMDTFQIDGRSMSTDGLMQTAFVYSTISKWLQLMSPNCTVHQTKKYMDLILLVSTGIYDYATGTAVYESARIMDLAQIQAIIQVMHNQTPDQIGVTIDQVQMTVLFTCLSGIRGHQALKGSVQMFRGNTDIGAFFADLIDNPILLQMAGRDQDLIQILNKFLFIGCNIDTSIQVRRSTTPYGASCLVFQDEDGSMDPFIDPGTYTFDDLVLAANRGRQAMFQTKFSTIDVAPCAGSTSYHGIRSITQFYNTGTHAIPTTVIGWRQDLVSILSVLFDDGRGGIAAPGLVQSMVLIMGDYFKTRQSWIVSGKTITDSGSLVGRQTFEMKVRMELRQLGFDTTGPITITDTTFDQMFAGSSCYFVQDFVADYPAIDWLALTGDLTATELTQVFVDNRHTF
jgi:hypothetical protein